MTETMVTASKSQSNNLLRRDVRFLGNILGEVLVHQGGTELLDIVEKIRETSKSLRAEFLPELYAEFKTMIQELDSDNRHQVIRAFAIYFQLVNIAEQNHRIRRKRDYERSAGTLCAQDRLRKQYRILRNVDCLIQRWKRFSTICRWNSL